MKAVIIMPRIPIPVGGMISLYEYDSNKLINLEITAEPLGYGGNCIVYEARSADGSLPCKYRLKELYPDINGISRNENNDLIISEQAVGKYSAAVKRFDNALKLLWNFAYSDETGCYTVCPLGKFYGRATSKKVSAEYLITQWMPSDSINTENICYSDDLYTAAKICLKAAYAADEFHKKGFINLDIKPENILYSPKTDTIALFDTDTIFKMNNSPNDIFYSQGAAPEIINGFQKLYSEKCDVFSIGSMLHRFITGGNYFSGQYSFPLEKDMNAISEYKMCKTASPFAISLVLKIFERCSSGNPSKRCDDTELIDLLTELADSSSPQSIYAINSTIVPGNDTNVYSDELYSVRKRLTDEHLLIIQGIHNSGKTDLAKFYAVNSRQYYHTVIWTDYKSNIHDTISSISFMGINDSSYSDANKLFEIKLDLLKKYDSNVLLIIDGCNSPSALSDKIWNELRLHILITSACSSDLPMKNIYIMQKQSDLMVRHEEISEFSKNMQSLKKSAASVKKVYIAFFIAAAILLSLSIVEKDLFGIYHTMIVIISILLMIIFKSMAFRYSDEAASASIRSHNCHQHYKTAVEFGNLVSNRQIFEISAPTFTSSFESSRHRFRIIIGLTAIAAGIITGAFSLYINSFPVLITSYLIILFCVFFMEYYYSTLLTDRCYNEMYGSEANNHKRRIREIYGYKCSTDQKSWDDQLSTDCMKQVIYNEYKLRCNLWGTFDVTTKFLAGFVIIAIVFKTLPLSNFQYFRIPQNVPNNIFSLLGLILFVALSSMQLSESDRFFLIVKDLLFTISSDKSDFIKNQYFKYSEELLLSKTSIARGIYSFAVSLLEKGIPIYEIRRAERPTFEHYCTTQKARNALYFLLLTSAAVCLVVWHFSCYSALLPILISSIGFQLWWFYRGIYFFNSKILRIRK